MLIGLLATVFVVTIIVFAAYIIQPKNFAKAFRVSETCNVSIPPSATMVQMNNCNIYTMFPSKPKRIIFFPGGAFIRCCIDFTPFVETPLNGYEVVMIQYRTLMEVTHMRPVVKDCAQVLATLLKDKKPTLVIGYSAGGYMASRSIEESNSVVPFLGLHGYYNLTTDYLLKFYSWLYVRDQIREVNADLSKIVTGDQDPLEESTDLFSQKFGVQKETVEGANHFTFYDLSRNQIYIDIIRNIIDRL